MTDFQPGDVVVVTVPNKQPRLGKVKTVNTRMRTAYVYVWSERIGGFTKSASCYSLSFLTMGDRVPPQPLSPQAVLDAILDNECAQIEPGAWCDYDIGTTWLTARKVDGHWQVKSVGGGE